MTSDEKKNATTLDEIDLLRAQAIHGKAGTIDAQIETLIYKSGLGKVRDALIAEWQALSARLNDEYAMNHGGVDIDTGAIRRNPPPAEAPAAAPGLHTV